MVTQYYTKKELKQYAKDTYQWCVDNFGSPLKGGQLPKLRIHFTNRRMAKGVYIAQSREIYIYMIHLTSIKDLVETIVHEYTHFLQMPKLNDAMKYHRLYMKDGYDNEFEREAYEAEEKYADVVLKHLNLI